MVTECSVKEIGCNTSLRITSRNKYHNCKQCYYIFYLSNNLYIKEILLIEIHFDITGYLKDDIRYFQALLALETLGAQHTVGKRLNGKDHFIKSRLGCKAEILPASN